jgi:hypothetical protein
VVREKEDGHGALPSLSANTPWQPTVVITARTVLSFFRQEFTLEDVIGFCLLLDRNLYSRMPLSFPPLVGLKRCHACGQWHFSLVFTPLTGWHCHACGQCHSSRVFTPEPEQFEPYWGPTPVRATLGWPTPVRVRPRGPKMECRFLYFIPIGTGTWMMVLVRKRGYEKVMTSLGHTGWATLVWLLAGDPNKPYWVGHAGPAFC